MVMTTMTSAARCGATLLVLVVAAAAAAAEVWS